MRHRCADCLENTTELDSPVECLIGFVAETTILSIKRATDDTIPAWYHAVSSTFMNQETVLMFTVSKHSKIFVKNSHFVWDPTRQRKLRKKLGNLVQSPKDTLDDMLEEHLEEVQNLLLQKKSEFEETNGLSSQTDEAQQMAMGGLRSPPLPSGAHTPKQSALGLREGSVPQSMRSPKMPALGYFSVSSASPRSPRSPMKRTF